ncbi:protein mono-ADP-ribosyltransferase PARP12-like [Porites lutea]|uniref:protein mono-ADP-ribosyltransferase PARP12-like n=1 Tax=Porites lutea TaxID=51062 RepID=UPI003CC665CD
MANESTPRQALEDFLEILLKNGGEFELGDVVKQLSSQNRRLVSDFGKLEFVKRYPELFDYKLCREVGKSKPKVMVKLDVPLQFCIEAGESSGCVSKECTRLHLCPFFIKGNCKFGLKCKRSHNCGDEHTVRVLEHFRLRFLHTSSSSLLQEILKMTLDESELQRAAAKRSVPDICKFYNKGTCKKEDNCHCLHVCQHYIDGDCKFGRGCKRKHCFSDPQNRKVLEEYDIDRIGELQVLQRLKNRERKRPSSGRFDVQIPLKYKVVREAANTSIPSAKPKDEKGKDDTEICGFNLCNKCKYGNSCIHRHTELPYLWEFAVDGDNWESFSCDVNTMLEHSYCDVQNGECTVMIRGILCRVQFTDMTAVPVLPHAGTSSGMSALNCTNPKIQRLSTVSSVVAAAGHVFSTRWRWYWQDENNKWQSYDTPTDGHAASTTSGQCLEREYMAEKDSHSFSVSHRQYTLYFKGWYQQNDANKTKRPVRRRPAEFVTKQNMDEIIAQRRRTASLAQLGITSASLSEPDALPSHWNPIPDGEDYLCVKLDITSDEYKRVEKKFQETMDFSPKIIKIERVQNPDLWTFYTQKRNRMAKKAGKDPEERQLFHGTKADTVEAICQQGFDWRVCGKHGTVYGKGSYFACKAGYSHGYTANQFISSSHKHMFLARVLVGSYTSGNSSLTRPPPKDPTNPHVLFDSCCDYKTSPSLFVVFENGQSYPEFLITYA